MRLRSGFTYLVIDEGQSEEPVIHQNIIEADQIQCLGPREQISSTVSRFESSYHLFSHSNNIKIYIRMFVQVIGAYFSMLKERDEKICTILRTRRPSFFLDPVFFQVLLRPSYNFENVKRWTRRLGPGGLLNLDKIFIPLLTQDGHWALIIFHVQERAIRYQEMTAELEVGRGDMFIACARRWFEDDIKDKMNVDYDTSSWKVDFENSLQENGYDCGVYVIMFARYLCDDLEPEFTLNDMPVFRARIAEELLKGSIPTPGNIDALV
jgi:Ulp1 family protease